MNKTSPPLPAGVKKNNQNNESIIDAQLQKRPSK